MSEKVKQISVLFCTKDSIYKTLGVDCWDEERNALNWPGGNPGIFHPPCRLFCKLKHFSSEPESEKELAYWSVDQVRKWGGVLEHPAYSHLWKDRSLPRPGKSDEFGFTFGVDQIWFGHLAQKRTWLYCCGITPKDLPDIPLRFCHAIPLWRTGKHRVGHSRRICRLGTPISFARWLISTAEMCHAG